jgi:hypothetical protein
MGKASKIVTLALIGAGVGTLAYHTAPGDDEDDYADDFGSSTQPATGTGGYGSRSYAHHSSGGWWFFGGGSLSGSSYRSGSGGSGSYHSSNSGTSRGGFGGIGHSSSGSHS